MPDLENVLNATTREQAEGATAGEPKHTPAPWRLNLARYTPTSPVVGFSIEADGKIPPIASAGVATPNHALIVSREFRASITTGFSEEEVEANAHLMTASPELLASLKDCHRWLLGQPGRSSCKAETLSELCDTALSVIAKAEGR